MFSVSSKVFFDKPGILQRMDRKTARVLSSTGAFTRTVMKRGMRKRKKIGGPGEFPSAHDGRLRNLIFFSHEPSTKSVVVGPLIFQSKRQVATGGKTGAQLLNEGGTAVRRRLVGRRAARRMVRRYRPRPFVALTRPTAAKKLMENMERFRF
jgi:hypothetical protein